MTATLEGLKRTDRGLRLLWSDGLESELSIWTIRCQCPCAHCVSETTGRRILDPSAVSTEIGLQDMSPVGNYAYRCLFSDGHDTGLYTLEFLRELSESQPG